MQLKWLHDLVYAYPGAVVELKQDHRFIKKRVNMMLGFGSFHPAHRTLRGIETMHMLRKGEVEGVAKGDIKAQLKFFTQIFDQAA